MLQLYFFFIFFSTHSQFFCWFFRDRWELWWLIKKIKIKCNWVMIAWKIILYLSKKQRILSFVSISFLKVVLTQLTFEFWFEYFCYVKRFLRAIMGFVSRNEAEEFLFKSDNETFLVRFSDSELGGITVAWNTG